MIKNITKVIISIMISGLMILCIINIVSIFRKSNFDKGVLNLLSTLFTSILFPIQSLILEFGHLLSCLYISKKSSKLKQNCFSASIICTSIYPPKFKTVFDVVDIPIKCSQSSYVYIRIFACSGFLFVYFLCWLLFFTGLYAVASLFLLLELVSLCNGRKSNDFWMFIEPWRYSIN